MRRSRSRLTQPERKSVVRAYRRGDKVEVIAADHGISAAHVCHLARAAGCRKRKHRRRTHPAVEAAVAAFLRSGGRIAEAKARWNICYKTVARIRDKAALPSRYKMDGGVDVRVLRAVVGGASTYREISRKARVTSRAAGHACCKLAKAGKVVRVSPHGQRAIIVPAMDARA